MPLSPPRSHVVSQRWTGARGLRLLSLIGSLGLFCAAGLAQTTGTPATPTDRFYQRASDCVAVMKLDVVALKARYLAGQTQVRPQMLRLTELGFSFIGTAYKRGLRKAEADALLANAEKTQRSQSADSLAKLSSSCQLEADRLLQKANVLERALISNRAKARVDDLVASSKSS